MPPVTLENLLAHRAWVRRVARALMRDESRAEDLEQEVWRKALARPPRDRGGLRGWLGTVLRRAAADQRRSEDRRSRHEKAAPSAGTSPDVADLVAEAESHRRVVTAVMALEEPARSTVLLRYFEDLPPREVARRLGVPVETVRTRLKRALPVLRSRLDAEHGGDGASWILALAPLARAPAGSPAPAALTAAKWGALIMGAKTKAAAVALLLALVLGWWSLSSPSRQAPPPPETGDESRAAAVSRPPAAEPRTGTLPRADGLALSGGAGPDDPESARTGAPPGIRVVPGGGVPVADAISGRVRDTDGRPVANATVELVHVARATGPAEALPKVSRQARTDENGEFRIEGLEREGRFLLEARAPGHRSQSAFVEPGTPGLEVTLRPSMRIAGVVVDRETGLGIAGMTLLARPPDAGPSGPAFPAVTGPDGRFDFGDSLAEDTYTLDVGNPYGDPGEPTAKYVPLRREGVGPGAGELRVEMDRGLPIGGTLLDAAGAPVTTTFTVELLGRTVHGNPDYSRRRHLSVESARGAFRFEGLSPGRYDLIVRPRNDRGRETGEPVAATVVRDIAAGSEGLRVTLRAGATITGRLVDDRGEPVTTGGYVYVYPEGSQAGEEDSVALTAEEDGTFETVPLDPGRRFSILATGFRGHMAGRAAGVCPGDPPVTVTLPRAGAIEGRVVDEEGNAVGPGIPVFAYAEGDVDRMREGTGMTAHTEAGGKFRIDALGDHVFTVVAGGGESVYTEGEPCRGVRVGTTDLVVGVLRGVVLSGRLVDTHGRAFKTHSLAAYRVDGVGSVGSRTSVEDEEGRFRFRGVAKGKVVLFCYHEGVYVNLGTFDAPAEDLVITVPDR